MNEWEHASKQLLICVSMARGGRRRLKFVKTAVRLVHATAIPHGQRAQTTRSAWALLPRSSYGHWRKPYGGLSWLGSFIWQLASPLKLSHFASGSQAQRTPGRKPAASAPAAATPIKRPIPSGFFIKWAVAKSNPSCSGRFKRRDKRQRGRRPGGCRRE